MQASAEHMKRLADAAVSVPMTLSDAHRVSVAEYAALLNRMTPHVLLDVRSEVQFGMISLADKLPASASLVHLPYERLSKAKDAADLALPDSDIPIYVLCRRGNHSVLATQHLLTLNVNRPMFNINGGLQSWSEIVDNNFPVY